MNDLNLDLISISFLIVLLTILRCSWIVSYGGVVIIIFIFRLFYFRVTLIEVVVNPIINGCLYVLFMRVNWNFN